MRFLINKQAIFCPEHINNVWNACRILMICFISGNLFATLGKKKGVIQPCCYSTVSPNTCTNTTAKPTPTGVSIRFLLLIGTLKLAISGVPLAEANTSFILNVNVKCLCHFSLFLFQFKSNDCKFTNNFRIMISFLQKKFLTLLFLSRKLSEF